MVALKSSEVLRGAWSLYEQKHPSDKSHFPQLQLDAAAGLLLVGPDGEPGRQIRLELLARAVAEKTFVYDLERVSFMFLEDELLGILELWCRKHEVPLEARFGEPHQWREKEKLTWEEVHKLGACVHRIGLHLWDGLDESDLSHFLDTDDAQWLAGLMGGAHFTLVDLFRFLDEHCTYRQWRWASLQHVVLTLGTIAIETFCESLAVPVRALQGKMDSGDERYRRGSDYFRVPRQRQELWNSSKDML
ncbi:uncharacterized protein B0I36DRAFT_337567 [Microdochium trichocladiopsis]|uniref:Uncharacterized protein n=1 Tax=Microdochium trichocladiopsis TaxID=1682393 RepID=A0A9P8XVG2_9PEZI|nr:uncharacterized protein B0I36DRAFT_337567 [Microdochium trichocladiopsis]KAH7016392.1 hypothetical protein B0I36DRAFT_337567 [Microdochium trichocladiopsis]